jgi:poly(3-hydroxybutyrate) depolymerase
MTDKNWMENATNMIALGKANDYVVVHPHKGTWSISTDKDVIFSLIEQAIEAFDVDRKRVHSTGYSQGGQISWALACEHADVIASVAPAEEINRVTDCWKTAKLPARDISVLFAFGKRDAIGGTADEVQTTVSDFVKSYSMTGPKTIAGAEGTNYHRQRWESAKGNVLEYISHNYTSLLAGHCLPLEGGATIVSCTAPVDYNWGEEAVLFFKAHPMP